MDSQEKVYLQMREMREQGKSWDEVSQYFEGVSKDGCRHRYGRAEKKFGSNVDDYIKENGIDPDKVSMIWEKNKNLSICTKYDRQTSGDIIGAFNEFIEEKYDVPEVESLGKCDGSLLVIAPADLHIGKLATFEGGEYNIQIALACAKEGVLGLIKRAKPYNIKKVVFVGGNDVLHIDNPKRTTTAGTNQDTDGMWNDALKEAMLLYREIVTWLKRIAPVHFVYCPSNHDYVMGQAVALSTWAAFYNDKNVTFDIDMRHRKYYKWGETMLAFSHGDGAKEQDLPQCMAQEQKKMWGETTYRYWHLAHVHHYKKVKWKSGEDYIGVTVQYLRSPSQSDRWHSDNGYIGAKRAIEGFIYSEDKGQEAFLTYNF